MADEQVSVKMHVDIRDPNDKLEFPLFAVADPEKHMIEYLHAMYPEYIQREFYSYVRKGSLIMALSVVNATDTIVLHKFFSLFRQKAKVHEIRLSATNVRRSQPYAEIFFEDVIITDVRPVQGDSDRAYYLVFCVGTGYLPDP
jgi:hypothetical protein